MIPSLQVGLRRVLPQPNAWVGTALGFVPQPNLRARLFDTGGLEVNIRKLFNGVMVLTLLLPALLAGSAAPTRASESLMPLKRSETTENLGLRPFAGTRYGEHSQTGESELAGDEVHEARLHDELSAATHDGSGEKELRSDGSPTLIQYLRTGVVLHQ